MSRHRRQASQVLPPPDQLFSATADDLLLDFSDPSLLATSDPPATSKPADGQPKAGTESAAPDTSPSSRAPPKDKPPTRKQG
ncbi:hypothetical protein MLD38_004169 [Melastoma candidum]|uniref:Uncharacterized protein n=1 Tax=Melastoma candidum TaxID=119954 RepID=A0ACB9S4L2_9MYRT|nr:hypothetical protein MLD38_004169 [Melastoma candidum]